MVPAENTVQHRVHNLQEDGAEEFFEADGLRASGPKRGLREEVEVFCGPDSEGYGW